MILIKINYLNENKNNISSLKKNETEKENRNSFLEEYGDVNYCNT